MKNRVKISVDGKGFTLVGEESEEHMRRVAAYIDEKMTEVREKAVAVTLDASLAYVLTSLNVADDYFKEKEYTAQMEGKLTGMAARMQEMTERLEGLERERLELAAAIEQEKREREGLKHKLEEAEKARCAAENKLDEYTMALENGGGAQLHTASARQKNRRNR